MNDVRHDRMQGGFVRRAGLALIAVSMVTACSTPAPSVRALAGNWQPVSAQLGGDEVPVANFAGATMQITGGSYVFGGDEGSYTPIADTSPPAIDVTARAGANAGRAVKAIYETTADTLVVCYQLGPGERPTAFASPRGTLLFLVRFRRIP